MGFPAHDGTKVDFGNGLVAQVSDAAGAVELYVYKNLGSTTGRDSDGNEDRSQPNVLRQIHMTKAQIDTFIAAFQTT